MKFQILVGALALQAVVASAQPYSGFGEPPPVPGGTVITFDSTPAGSYSSLNIGDVTFNGVAANGYGTQFTIGPDYNGSYNTSGGQSLLNGFGFSPDAFSFVFGTAVNNFAFNFGASDNDWILNAYSAGNTLLASTDIAPTRASNAGDYFGIAEPGIAYATLSDTGDDVGYGDYVFIDDFTYVAGSNGGGGSNVPDGGSSMALLGMALVPLLRLGLKSRAA